MDWVSAWAAAVPVYGFAVIVHAIFPPFAVPVWVIFYVYARKILDGARMAEDPWRGRGSPRPYLTSWSLAIVFHYSSYVVSTLGGSASAAVTAVFAHVAALLLAPLFMASAAPPAIRDAKAWTRLAVGAEFLASLAAPAVLFDIGLVEGPAAAIVYFGQVALAGLSVAAFEAARRRTSRRPPVLARKAPRE